MAARIYWFKARKNGVGWVPNNWKGWTVLVLYIGFMLHSFFQIDATSHSASDTLINYFPRVLLFTAILTVITYLKGEPTTWNNKHLAPSEEHHKKE